MFSGGWMRLADDRGFHHRLMADESAFDFSDTDPVPGHFHGIIRPAHKPQVAVFIFMADVAGGVCTGDGNSIQERTIFKNPKSFRISLWLIFSIGYNFSYENESAACGAKTVIRS